MQNSPTRNPCANTPGRSKSSSPARRAEPRSRRCLEISLRRRFAACAASLALLPAAGFAATPAPTPTHRPQPLPARIDVTKIQPKSLLPKHGEHTEFVVEINKLGQVTRVRSQRYSDSATFNSQTYGNALQAFIRTPDGHVILGTYRLTYDFDPKTARVRRDVSLVSQGGVDPNAKGAAVKMLEEAHAGPVDPDAAPNGASIDPRDLPVLEGVTAPTATPTSPH